MTTDIKKNKFNECNYHMDLQPGAELNSKALSGMASKINSCYDCSKECGVHRTLGSRAECLQSCDFTLTEEDKKLTQYFPRATCLPGAPNCTKPINVKEAMKASSESIRTPCDVFKSESHGFGFKCDELADCESAEMLKMQAADGDDAGPKVANCAKYKHCRYTGAETGTEAKCEFDRPKLQQAFNACKGECQKKTQVFKILNDKECVVKYKTAWACSDASLKDEKACEAAGQTWSATTAPEIGLYYLHDAVMNCWSKPVVQANKNMKAAAAKREAAAAAPKKEEASDTTAPPVKPATKLCQPIPPAMSC